MAKKDNGSRKRRSDSGKVSGSNNSGKDHGRSSAARGGILTRQNASAPTGRAGSPAGRSPGKSSRTSPAKRSAEGGGAVDALDLLKAQHREVEGLFKQFERAGKDENTANNERFEVAQLICQKLTVHATIEEEILYPRARAQGEQSEEEELKDQVLEALEEHLSAKRLIADIQGLEADDERLEAKISVLKEQVSHHVDEEEDEMFPQLKKELSKDERRALGQQLEQRTGELEMNADGDGPPRQPGSSTKSQHGELGRDVGREGGREVDRDEGSQDHANGASMNAGTQHSDGRQPSQSSGGHHSHH